MARDVENWWLLVALAEYFLSWPVLAVLQTAKCSGNHQPVRNNFGSVRIALQSSRR
jgi:hypothetical protein